MQHRSPVGKRQLATPGPLLLWIQCWTLCVPLCLALLWPPSPAHAAETSLLSPPDTSSPSNTFNSFLTLTDQIAERYAAYREAPSAALGMRAPAPCCNA